MWADTLAYRRYLEPFLPIFFEEAARRMGLTRDDRLLDVGCGPGTLAFDFAPYVGALTGVEPEEAFLAAARDEAARRAIPIRLIHASAEAMPDDIGPFELVTIGRAHWYLPREATCAKLERLVAKQGKVLVCWSSTADPQSGEWAGIYRDLRKAAFRRPMPRMSAKQFFAGSAFRFAQSFVCMQEGEVNVEDLLYRAMAFPEASPAELGDRKERYLATLRAALTPFARDGVLKETIASFGAVFVRG